MPSIKHILLTALLAVVLAGCASTSLPAPSIVQGQIAPTSSAYQPGDWQRLPGWKPDEIFWGITAPAQGPVWFATNHGVWRWDGAAWTRFSPKDGLPSESVTAMTQAADGTLYVAACPGGVYRLRDERWVLVGGALPKTIEEHCPWTLLAQADDELWAGLMNARLGQQPGYGLARFTNQAWRVLYPNQAQLGEDLPLDVVNLGGRDVFKIVQTPDGKVWVLTDAGLAQFDGQTWRNLSNKDLGSESRLWNLLAAADGSLWLGGEKGALHYDGKTWTTYDSPNLAPIAAAADGTVYFAGEGTLLRLKGGLWETIGTPPEFVAVRVLSAAVGPDGALWMGTVKGGVYRYLPGAAAALPERPAP
jgi:ligand-binding sensor domain-containing protein